MSNLKRSLISGFFWSSAGQICIIAITLFTNIFLARILGPKEFGQVGIIVFFTTLANVLIAGGLAGAVIRLPEATVEDFKTVFTFNFFISIICYLMLWFSAPYIADFYNEPIVEKLLLVSGLILFINAFQLINNAILIRNMRIKQRSIYNFVAVVAASIVAILAAVLGAGVWSLVLLQLSIPLFIVIQFVIFEEFFAHFGWNNDSFKKLYKFGINTTLSNLLNTAFLNIYSLILGKYFSISQVGYFYQAQKLQQVPGTILNYFSQNVLFSGLSKLQHDITSFNRAYNKVVGLLNAILGYITIITFLFSKEIILLLYGEEWIGSSIYLQLLIIAAFFYMQEQFNRVIFKVFDQTRQVLYLEIIKKTIQSITIVVGVIYNDIFILLIGFVATNVISSGINYYYSRKIVNNHTEYLTVLKIILTGTLATFIGLGVDEIIFPNKFIGLVMEFFITTISYLALLQLTQVLNLKKDIAMLTNTLKRG